MNESLMERAYISAREHHRKALVAISSTLDEQFQGVDFDTLYQASRRGMKLYLAASTLAERIWAQSLSYEKAEQILVKQFSDFASATLEKALRDAYQEAR